MNFIKIIERTSRNSKKMVILANEYYYGKKWNYNPLLILQKKIMDEHDNSVLDNPIACDTTALALVQCHLFKHDAHEAYYCIRKIENYMKKCKTVLYYFGISDGWVIDSHNNVYYYPGHAFVIVQIKNKFYIYQSYVDEYDLKEYIEKNRHKPYSFDHVKRKVLAPLEILQANPKCPYNLIDLTYDITGIWFMPRNLKIKHSRGIIIDMSLSRKRCSKSIVNETSNHFISILRLFSFIFCLNIVLMMVSQFIYLDKT